MSTLRLTSGDDAAERREVGIAALLDLLTTLWAEEAVAGAATRTALTVGAGGGRMVSGAAVRANASAAPDPQRGISTRGLP